MTNTQMPNTRITDTAMMKRIYLFLLTLFCAAVMPPGYAQTTEKLETALATTTAQPPLPVDRIVAVVNEDIITLHELNERKHTVLRQLEKQGTPLPPDDVLSRQVLERMISDMVQVQLAKETGVKVDDIQLDRTLQRIAQDNKLDPTQFRAAVEKDGLSYSAFREDIRNEILLSRLREREVDNTINVSEAEVDAELAAQAGRQSEESEYRVQHILVLVPDQATPEQIEAKRGRAALAAQAISRGTDFGQAAATYSESADALSGGNLGWRTASRLPSLFVESLGNMKPGEVSPVLKSPNGFHIFKLLETRNTKAGAPVVGQTHVRHILLRPKDGVSDAESRQRLEALKTRLDGGTDFGELAKLQSDDGSAANGGDLGWVAAGETVPEFEQAMNDLKPGQVSAPIHSQFGWHLIQVIERRQSELSGDKKKLAIRQAVRARKADEAYQDWLRQIRDKAFVENRLEEK